MSVRFDITTAEQSNAAPANAALDNNTLANSTLRRAVVASSSLLAISAAMGWSEPAMATGTCGAPSGHVVNCNQTNYPTGIEYFGPDGVDDLTVNIGSFAGQNGAVTVTSGVTGVYIGAIDPANNVKQKMNVGSNVIVNGAEGLAI